MLVACDFQLLTASHRQQTATAGKYIRAENLRYLMSLLTEIHEQKCAAREQLRLQTRARCRALLQTLLPAGTQVAVYGSLTKPFAFNSRSDVDLAFNELPNPLTSEKLAIQLEAGLDRPVDAVLLDQTRLKAAILRTGEIWTL